MSDKIDDELFEKRPNKPNFLLVVILSGVTILILFAVAYLLLSDTGKRLLPRLHPDAHPTSYVVPATGSESDG